jgi:hypothetical protein
MRQDRKKFKYFRQLVNDLYWEQYEAEEKVRALKKEEQRNLRLKAHCEAEVKARGDGKKQIKVSWCLCMYWLVYYYYSLHLEPTADADGEARGEAADTAEPRHDGAREE